MNDKKVLYKIRSLEKMVGRFILKNEEIKEKCKFIPTPTQMQIIEYILENNDKEIYQKDLEEILNLRRATVSGVLHTMEKNNLIERVIDKNDTRTKKIILSKETKDIYYRNQKRLDEIEKIIIKDISEDDLNKFFKVIDQMKDNLNNHVANRDGEFWQF